MSTVLPKAPAALSPAALTDGFDSTVAEETAAIREVAADLFADRCGEERRRALIEEPDRFDRELWATLAEVGFLGVLVEERLGGAGLRLREAAVLLEEAGRHLYGGPLLGAAVLVPQILSSSDSPRADELLGALVAGTTIAVAVPPGDGVAVTGTEVSDSLRLDGEIASLANGTAVDQLLVAVARDDRYAWVLVDLGGDGVDRLPLESLDLTRRYARVSFRDAVAHPIAEDRRVDGGLSPIAYATFAGLAQEQCGGARQALEMAVDYAKERIQYGRPIGSFQALKHKCADLLMQVEFAASGAAYAAWCADEAPERLDVAALAAHAAATDAYVSVAKANIQLHGGIGFTWEHPAHLYLRRAKSDAAALLPRSVKHQALAGLVGGERSGR
jgi:acyl-CoA dehydrogenase